MYRPLVNEPSGPHDPERVLLPALLTECPSFLGTWEMHVTEWPDPATRGVYLDLGAFATYLVALLAKGETAEFPGVFATVERYLRDGDDGIRYALKLGLLETLGNVASNEDGWPLAARFREWFGPLTAAAWNDLHDLWGTSDTG